MFISCAYSKRVKILLAHSAILSSMRRSFASFVDVDHDGSLSRPADIIGEMIFPSNLQRKAGRRNSTYASDRKRTGDRGSCHVLLIERADAFVVPVDHYSMPHKL